MAKPTLQDLLNQVSARKNELIAARAGGVIYPDYLIDQNTTTQDTGQNVSQFGPVDATVDSYKQAAEYAKESEDWAKWGSAQKAEVQTILNNAGDKGTLVALAQDTGATKIGTSDGKTVQAILDLLNTKIFPEEYGAIGDGVSDDTVAIQKAADALVTNSQELHFNPDSIYKISSPIKLPFVANYDIGLRRNFYGNNCTLKTTGDFEPFNQYTDASKTTTSVVKLGCNFFDFTIRGFANKDSKYNNVIHTHGISFGYGRVERIKGFGLCNVIRAYGESFTRDLHGDDLRNALYSCYATQADPNKGNNKLFNASVGWVSGDGLILKGPDIYVDGFTYEYAGCISLNAEDGIDTVRGAGVSCGADGQVTSNVTLLNISGKFYGANGLSVAATNVFIGGVINVGSYYPDNFIVAKTGEAFYFDIKNAQIGDLYSNKCHKGMIINPSSHDFKIGKVNFISKSNVTQSQLFSISDATNRTITNAYIEGVYLHGACTLNDEVYLNTEDLKIDEIYLADVSNLQGGRVINFARPCKVGTLHTITRSANADNDIVHIDSAAEIDNIIIDHVFGTAITIKEDVVPIIGNVSILRKQGVKPPIVINGLGTSTHVWGDVRILGGSIARPTLTGTLYMASYKGPKWIAQGVTHPAEVYFPEFVKADLT